MKKILCIVVIFLLLCSFPFISMASDEIIYVDSGNYEVSVKQGIDTYTGTTSGSKGWEWFWLPSYRTDGASYNIDFSFTIDDLSSLEKSYIESAETVSIQYSFGGGGFGSGIIGVMYFGEHYGDLSVGNAFIRLNFTDNSTATVDINYIYGLTGSSINQTNAKATYNGGFDGRALQDIELGLKVIMYPNGTEAAPAMISQNIGAVITCTYSDGSDKVIVVNKEILGQLGEIGGKLDGVQDSINQGFDGILNPDQGDVDRNDQIAGDLEDNKNEVNDIIDAMDSVDKPNVDDAFDLVDPEQIVDLENDCVQEMTAILASVTENSVVKNYLLLLFGIGLVSFIFFGKKGG